MSVENATIEHSSVATYTKLIQYHMHIFYFMSRAMMYTIDQIKQRITGPRILSLNNTYPVTAMAWSNCTLI